MRFANQGSSNTVWLGCVLILGLAASAAAQISNKKPRADDPADHAFATLGAPDERKVQVAWNRFYDHAGLGAILARLHKAYPNLTRLYSIGESVEERELWCLEVTAKKVGDPERKPAMYIDGNIHGNEVQGGEVVAYTAWYLCSQYGHVDKVTELLDRAAFYLIPTINPDGRDRWFHRAQTASSSRSGLRPLDNDRDGLIDEDDTDDLNGDGSITQMRKSDPNGRWKAHPDYPEHLMIRAEADEPGEFTLLGSEGIDNDGDGRINEDGAGGYDINRNWAFDWQPNFIQRGAQDYPFSLPETRAISRFVLSRPNIAAMQSYHNSGGMILRSPGRQGGVMRPSDERVLRFIGERGVKIIPFYRNYIIWSDLYTVWGGEIDWFYGGRGIISFSNELWTPRNLDKGSGGGSRDDQARFMKYVLLEEGIVKWEPFDHPTYGEIEIGGIKQQWGRAPPSFLLEEECHRNMAFTLYHADMMPKIAIAEVRIERLGEQLYKVWVTIENTRLIPTRSGQEVYRSIGPPDVVSLAGRRVEVLSSGRVTDRFFGRAEAVRRRPERVELATIGGMSAERVQFIVSGRGEFTVTVDSAKGGLLTTEGELR